jgi:hypothetical protein
MNPGKSIGSMDAMIERHRPPRNQLRAYFVGLTANHQLQIEVLQVLSQTRTQGPVKEAGIDAKTMQLQKNLLPVLDPGEKNVAPRTDEEIRERTERLQREAVNLKSGSNLLMTMLTTKGIRRILEMFGMFLLETHPPHQSKRRRKRKR